MSEVESWLSPILDKIAKEQKYENHTRELSLVDTGGANYSSLLYNVTLSAPGKDDLKLFVKVAKIGEQIRSLATMQPFEKEVIFYTTIQSKYRSYEDKYNFSEDSRMILPKYYGSSDEYMKETLVLEELISKGFESFDRFSCYDWEYASKCISALARFHALSVKYEKDDPDDFAKLADKMKFQFPIGESKGFMEKSVHSAIEATADEYKGRLAMFIQENLTEANIMKYFNPKRKVVLVHADFRPSNVLHKRNKDGNLEVALIDYQGLQKGNPVADLLNFLIGGSDEAFREKYWMQYFEHYYQEFSNTLRLMEINPDDVYLKADYDADLKEMIPYGVVLGMITLPFITVDVKNVPKVEDAMDFDSFAMVPSDLFKIRFNGLIKDYVKMGIL